GNDLPTSPDRDRRDPPANPGRQEPGSKHHKYWGHTTLFPTVDTSQADGDGPPVPFDFYNRGQIRSNDTATTETPRNDPADPGTAYIPKVSVWTAHPRTESIAPGFLPPEPAS